MNKLEQIISDLISNDNAGNTSEANKVLNLGKRRRGRRRRLAKYIRWYINKDKLPRMLELYFGGALKRELQNYKEEDSLLFKLQSKYGPAAFRIKIPLGVANEQPKAV